MASFSVTKATEKDHESLLRALEIIRLDSSFNTFQFSWNSENFLAELKVAETLICKSENSEVLSFLSYRKNQFEYEIMVLATLPMHRQKGLQSQLIKALLAEARLSHATVWLEVHEKNSSAIELYKKNKFVSEGRRSRYYKDGADALLMKWSEKLLEPS